MRGKKGPPSSPVFVCDATKGSGHNTQVGLFSTSYRLRLPGQGEGERECGCVGYGAWVAYICEGDGRERGGKWWNDI